MMATLTKGTRWTRLLSAYIALVLMFMVMGPVMPAYACHGSISVTKVAAPLSLPEPGGVFTYTYVVKNDTDVDQTLKSVTDSVIGPIALPADVTLSPGESTVAMTGTKTYTEVGTYPNTVTAVATDKYGHTHTATASASVKVTKATPALTLDKTTTTECFSKVGDVITYTYKVTNSGDVMLHGSGWAVIDDKTTVDVSSVAWWLAPGESFTVSASYTVTEADLAAGEVTNIAYASGYFGDAIPVISNKDCVTVHRCTKPSISITKVADPLSLPEPGGLFTYSFVVTNNGPVAVTLESVTDSVIGAISLPADVTLNPGESTVAMTGTKTHTEAGTYPNTVTAVAKDSKGNKATATASASVTVTEVKPSISITKVADPLSRPEPGGLFTYTYVVTNNGIKTVTLETVTDSVIGAISLPADVTLSPGESTVAMTGTKTYTEAGTYANTVTAVAKDSKGNEAVARASASVTVTDVKPIISVTKVADPLSRPEPGGLFTYTFVVTNNGVETVTLTSVTDDKIGPITLPADVTLAPGESTVAMISTATHVEAGLYPNTVTAKAVDNEGNEAVATASASVTVTDVKPIISVTKVADPLSRPEPGGLFTYTFVVTNNSVETVTLTSVTDSVIGAITLPADVTLSPGESTVAMIATATHVEAGLYPNTVTAKAVDNEGNEAVATASASVTVTDVKPIISVTKVADPLSRPEPGGLFTYTFVVTNNSVETVTLTSVTDSVIGAITLPADVTLSPGESTVAMIATATHVEAGLYPNTVTAKAVDNEGNEAVATASASVTVTDVKPIISVSKVANPLSLPEPGGLFTYTYLVTNNSVETVTLTSVTDSVLGAIPLPSDVTLSPGESTVAIIATATYAEAGSYPNTVTAKAVDNEGNEAVATADASVTVTDVKPDISVTKVADPLSRPEPGGLFTYTFVVTNNGVETVTLTSVTDSVLGAIPLPADVTLAPGESTVAIIATATYVEVGLYPNTVTAIAVDNEGNADTATADASVTVTDVMPTLEVVKSVTPLEMNMPGGSFDYSVTVTNTSVEPVKVTLVEDDAYGIVYQWIAEAPEIWLAPGESRVFEFAMDHTAPGEYPNTVEATVQDNEGNTASATDDAVVTVWNPAIRVVKSSDAPDNFVARGTLVTYTFVVTNVGDVDLFNVVVTDDKLGVVGTLETLAVGASETFTASATLNDTTTNVVVATGEDKNENEVTDQDTLTVETFVPFTPLDLAIEKIVSNATFEPGDVVTYTLRYRNLGMRPATGFTIVDDFDERYVSVLDANGGVVANGKITWTIAGPLTSADGLQTLTYTVRVKADMPNGTTTVGNIVVISHPDDEDLTNNRDEASILVKEEPFLPFTGGDAMLLLMVAFLSAATGLFLRRRAA